MRQLLKVLSVGFCSVLVAACGGGNAFPSGTTPSALQPAPHGSKTFDYTRAAPKLKAPARVRKIRITAYGASGGGGGHGLPQGGLGAAMKATFSVTPGKRLQIFVGGEGGSGPGFNGGGGGVYSGGGGSSDVRTGSGSL